jgi:hypothetical protein
MKEVTTMVYKKAFLGVGNLIQISWIHHEFNGSVDKPQY